MSKQLTLIVLSIFLVSCDQAPEKRRYEEIVIKNASPRPMMDMMGAGEDPHAFMRNMPSAPDMKDIPINDELTASVTKAPLSWQTPEGWQEKAGSGMRVATFIINDKNQKAECSIVSLGKEAGTLQSNAVRWAQQINILVSDHSAFDRFLSAQPSLKTKDGTAFKLVDFTSLQDREGEVVPSMIAAIVSYPDKTVFVKLAGSKRAVSTNREKFKIFCQSLKLKN